MVSKSYSLNPGVRDFPYYAGHPVSLSVVGWFLVLGMTAAGYAALMASAHPWHGPVEHWVGVLLFIALPIAGLRLAAGHHWKVLFVAPTWRDLWIGLAFVPAVLAGAALSAILIMKLGPATPNPAVALLERLKGLDLALFLSSTPPQIFGEELLTVLFLLALLTIFRSGFKQSRSVSIVLAWALSACVFGALHLPTYGWRLGQVMAIVAGARLVLSLPYLITKNIWAPTVTHVTHDWIAFVLVLATLRMR